MNYYLMYSIYARLLSQVWQYGHVKAGGKPPNLVGFLILDEFTKVVKNKVPVWIPSFADFVFDIGSLVGCV